MPRIETYLGDGVYCTIEEDGMIKLDLRAQDSSVIYLEPEVYENLEKLVNEFRSKEQSNAS